MANEDDKVPIEATDWVTVAELNKEWNKEIVEKTRSIELHSLFAALAEARGEFMPVIFDQSNPYFDSKFASLNALQAATTPALSKHGIHVIHCPTGDGVKTILTHSSGQYLSNYLPMAALKDDAQGVGGGITYATRYNYASMLNIAGEEDKDGNGPETDVVIGQEVEANIFDRLLALAPEGDVTEKYLKRFCKKFNVELLSQLKESQLPDALKALEAAEKRAKK